MNEPYLSFQHAKLKVQWANQQIDHLQAVHDTFVENNRNLPLIESQGQSGVMQYRVDGGIIPDEIPLLAGDAIRNLRGSLDYCWTGLDRARGIDKSNVTLPIANNRKGVKSSVENTEVGKAFPGTVKLLEDLGAHADFDDNGNRPLLILNRLSNWEKHNLLIFTIQRVRTFNVTVQGMRLSTIDIQTDRDAPVELHGSRPWLANSQSEANSTSDIIFGKHDFAEGEPLFPLMRQISKVASEVIEAFEKRFV
jgi:hypothetical protein